MSYLENLYSQNMVGGNYIPFNSLDIFNQSYYVGNGGGNVETTPPQTIPGNDIRFTFSNLSQYKNQMTFNVQGQSYQETNSVSIDSNTINDTLIIKPSVNDNYTLKNYFELRKKLVTKEIITREWVLDFTIDAASSLYGYGNGLGSQLGGHWEEKVQTTQITGIVINNYNPSIFLASFSV